MDWLHRQVSFCICCFRWVFGCVPIRSSAQSVGCITKWCFRVIGGCLRTWKRHGCFGCKIWEWFSDWWYQRAKTIAAAASKEVCFSNTPFSIWNSFWERLFRGLFPEFVLYKYRDKRCWRACKWTITIIGFLLFTHRPCRCLCSLKMISVQAAQFLVSYDVHIGTTMAASFCQLFVPSFC